MAANARHIGSQQPGDPCVGRRAAVPGGEVRHRDAIPAPRVRGVRAQGSAPGRCIPRPERVRLHDQCGDRRRVRAYGLPLRPHDAAGPDRPALARLRVERDRPIDAFLNPLAFDQNDTLTAEEAAGAIVRGTTRQIGNAIDEFKTEALRNNLLGLPLDLATINLARGRDTGIPSLNDTRAQFYQMTGDSQLTPYTSWVDFSLHLKHVESLVNFIAAYGTHSSITSETTLAGKRAAAMAIVFGVNQTLDPDGIPGNADDRIFIVPSDSLDFLNSTGAWANDSGLHPKDVDKFTTTGLGNVDLWVGGLAEEIMPFGGMLGSTFNFVFETQLESLQDGDRFYYLARTAGMNFLTELENNAFSKLVMLNTDVTHLPDQIFKVATWTLEVDPTKQFTGLGIDGRDDPGTLDDPTGGIVINGVEIAPVVIRDNPATTGPDTNYLQYTGENHIVLGGSAGNDILISGIGDDTLYGDAGNDRLEGGFGNDVILGGLGDDIITDMGGDD